MTDGTENITATNNMVLQKRRSELSLSESALLKLSLLPAAEADTRLYAVLAQAGIDVKRPMNVECANGYRTYSQDSHVLSGTRITEKDLVFCMLRADSIDMGHVNAIFERALMENRPAIEVAREEAEMIGALMGEGKGKD